jgi:hypothetical protein
MWARGLARAAQPGRKEGCRWVDGEGEGAARPGGARAAGRDRRAAAERLEMDGVGKGLPAQALVEDELGSR